MAGILRGEIRWADLSPVLISSHDIFNVSSGTVIAVASTSQPQKAGFPLTLELKSAGSPKKSWLKISSIRTLSVERIGKIISNSISKSSAIFVGVVVGFLNVCIIRLVASS